MPRLSRSAFVEKLSPEDQRAHRKWVIGLFTFYCLLVCGAVAISVVNRPSENQTAANTPIHTPTQKLRPSSLTVGQALMRTCESDPALCRQLRGFKLAGERQ